MKYVIFKQNQLFMPVIVPEVVVHSQIKIEGAEPISAGFVEIGVMGTVKRIYGRSESLNLEPHKRDEKLLTAALIDSGTNSFIDYE